MRRSASTSRRWCVPPSMLRDPDETLEGAAILEEVPGELGALLWRTVRDLTLWASTPPNARNGLFAERSGDARLSLLAAADVPAPISTALDTITGMLSLGARADAHLLTICSLEVAAWARLGGLHGTAVAFAQAGALASPDFAEAALHTGLYAAASGQEARAETWLRRAVALARREDDQAAYSAALVELGEMYERRGDAEGAIRFYRWAYNSGRRFGFREGRLRAAYGLFRLARGRGDDAAAAQHALQAQRAYAPSLRGGADLLIDLVRFWTAAGEPARARAAAIRLDRVRDRLPSARQLAACGLVARALAGAASATAATQSAWLLMSEDGIGTDPRLSALLDLAYAARAEGDVAAFARARRALLMHAPADRIAGIMAEVEAIWPEAVGQVLRLGKAS